MKRKMENAKIRKKWMGIIQNTVPSDIIMIGGSLVLGLDTSASSRPPWTHISLRYSG